MTTSNYNYPEGTKVQSYDKDGYYVISMCGTIAKQLPNGHAIVKSFDGHFYSSVSFAKNVFSVESV